MLIGYNYWDQLGYCYGVQNRHDFLITKYSNIYHEPVEITELYSLAEIKKLYEVKEIVGLYSVREITELYELTDIP